MITEKDKPKLIRRMKAIKGQVEGVQRMIEDEKYCIDIINQITAIRGALDKVALLVMNLHIRSCVVDAVRTDIHDHRADKKIRELMDTMYKFVK
ncbi:MAG: metal-sensitive transcriptional regulator [Fidelibacterota bacterium]